MANAVPLPSNSEDSEGSNKQQLPPGVEICRNNRVVSRHKIPEWKPNQDEHYESD